MARTGIGKLQEARELDGLADGLKKRDPEASRQIQRKANQMRQRGIKQLGSKPKRVRRPL